MRMTISPRLPGLAAMMTAAVMAGPVRVAEPGKAKAPEAQAGQKAAAALPPYPTPEEREKIAAMADRLTEDIRKGEPGQTPDALNALDAIMISYPGDPLPLMEDGLPLLSHESMTVRVKAAANFLRLGRHRGEAVTVLRACVVEKDLPDEAVTGNRPVVIPGKPVPLSEAMEDPETLRQRHQAMLRERDPRKAAAAALAEGGVKEAADDIWALYQRESYPELLRALARLGDRRPVQAVIDRIAARTNPFFDSDLIAFYRIGEAEEPLRKSIAAFDTMVPPRSGKDLVYRYAAEAALFRLDGDPAHLRYLLDRSGEEECMKVLVRQKAPEVLAFLRQILTDRGPGDHLRMVVGLYRNDPHDPVVRQELIGALSVKAGDVGRDRYYGRDPEVLCWMAAALHDPEIDLLGQQFEDRDRRGIWLRYYNRRNLPFPGNDLESMAPMGDFYP